MKKVTISELEDIGDIMYQRAFKVRAVAEDETKPELYRIKAFALFMILMNRVQSIAREYNKATMSKANFQEGGITVKV